MKIKRYFSLLICCLFCSITSFAQHFHNSAEYINFIGKQHKDIAEDITTYAGALVDGTAKKQESKRKEILQELKIASKRVATMHPYKVDKSLQDSALEYFSVSYKVLNHDVPRILHLEDSVGKSYNASENYLNAKEKAIGQLAKAEESLNRYAKVFVDKYQVKEEYNDDEVYQKLQEINKVNTYYRSIYLIFLKSQKLEDRLVDAIVKKDTAKLKNQNEIFAKSVREGLIRLDTMQGYKSDNGLVLAAKQALLFYQTETEFKVPTLINVLEKEDAFIKTKKSIESKSANQRTPEEMDRLAKETSEHNDQIATYTNTVNDLNLERPKVEMNWKKVSQSFLAKYIQ